MGRKLIGEAPKDKQVNIRLDKMEDEMLQRKRARRGLDQSTYFRTLMKEDPE